MTRARRAEYDQATGLVRGLMHAWDPYGLLAGGAPDDEFDVEIACIVRELPRIADATDATRVLAEMFAESFGEPFDLEMQRCQEYGRQLFVTLRASCLLPWQ